MQLIKSKMGTFKSFFILLLVDICVSHPICLSAAPPYIPDYVVPFCEDYQQATCCSVGREMEIKTRYEYLTNLTSSPVPGDVVEACRELIKVFLCAECNPFAGHIFSFPVERDFGVKLLSLGPHYCRKWLQGRTPCHQVIGFLYKNVSQLEERAGKGRFCDYQRDVYYYPKHKKLDDFKTPPVRSSSDDTSSCVCAKKIVGGLKRPVELVAVPDQSNRYVVVDYSGYINILYLNGTFTDTPYLDVTDRIYNYLTEFADDNGMSSVSFHPDFANNGFLYVLYPIPTPPQRVFPYQPPREKPVYTYLLSRFTQTEKYGNRIDQATERILMAFDMPADHHGADQLLFGPDGFLYISIGDGGDPFGDPFRRAQNISEPFGKILRIDVNVDEDSADPGAPPYFIPPDNPYTNSNQTSWWEIYALGLRNPWRCSFDRGDEVSSGGRLFCGDNGKNDREEVDIIENGANYGWPLMEGDKCYRIGGRKCGKRSDLNLTDPIISYSYLYTSKAVIGGYVYRGRENLLPSHKGSYIFADFSTSSLFAAQQESGVKYRYDVLPVCKSCPCGTGLYGESISSLAEDVDGELYLLSLGIYASKDKRGEIYKLMQWKEAGESVGMTDVCP